MVCHFTNSSNHRHGSQFCPLSPAGREVNQMLKFFVAAQCRAMDLVDDLRKSEEGQTMAEYGVVLAVITLVIVGTLLALSGAINGDLGRVQGALK